MADELDPTAPHGRDENGTPYAPYGYKANGDPKLNNRGRPPANAGPKVAAPKRKTAPNTKAGARPRSRTDAQTKTQLMELATLATTPLSAAASSPVVRRKLGERHADALAGDAVILDAFAEPLIDGVIHLAKSKPGLLAWMDQVEDKAPYLMLAQTGLQAVKAIVQNHMNPDPALARAGRKLAQVRAAQYAAAIEQQAAELGITDENVVTLPEQRAA